MIRFRGETSLSPDELSKITKDAAEKPQQSEADAALAKTEEALAKAKGKSVEDISAELAEFAALKPSEEEKQQPVA